jgi:transcription elongation factor GreB
MSKAFTRESDDDSAEEVVSGRPQVPGGAKHYLTREGADRLRQRLGELLEERRGLMSESAETNANAKAALHRVEAAIQKLESALDSVIVVEPPADQGKVALGASVRVRDEQGEEDAYQIVGVEEADPAQGRISSVSPLARALISRRAGDKVSFQTPAGSRELTILAVHY